jgi:hypothetical protein
MFEIDTVAELKALKKEADELGISYNPNIGLAKLQARISEHKGEEVDDFSEEQEAFIKKAKLAAERMMGGNIGKIMRSKMPKSKAKYLMMKDANKLVRVSVTCLDPAKKDVPGQWMGIRNSMIPVTKKYIPYDGRVTHLPKIIINHLKEKECQVFKVVTDPVTNDKSRKPFTQKMFSVSELPPLNDKQLTELAEAQRAAGTIA